MSKIEEEGFALAGREQAAAMNDQENNNDNHDFRRYEFFFKPLVFMGIATLVPYLDFSREEYFRGYLDLALILVGGTILVKDLADSQLLHFAQQGYEAFNLFGAIPEQDEETMPTFFNGMF